jgi:hypothetical protein
MRLNLTRTVKVKKLTLIFNNNFLFFRHLKNYMSISGKHVLVIGSQAPWMESLILEAGANKTTTLGKNG